MEVKELSEHKLSHAIYKPFALTSFGRKLVVISPESNSCTFLQPVYTPRASDEFMFKIEEATAPTLKPTAPIIKKFNTKLAYENAELLERQNFTLDPLYADAFTDIVHRPKVNCVCFPSEGAFTTPLLALVSNFGACEIRVGLVSSRSWTKTAVCVNDLWQDLFDHSALKSNFKDIEQQVNDFHVTNCCWADTPLGLDECTLYCATASGWVVSLRVRQDGALVSYKAKTELYKINCMKHFLLRGKKGTQSLLLVGDINGKIHLFKDVGSNLELLCVLWGKRDDMRSLQFDVQLDNRNKRIIVVTSKAAHFLAFLLDFSGNLLRKSTKLLGGGIITGIVQYKQMEYIVASAACHVTHIILSTVRDKLEIQSSPVSHGIDSEKYQLLGLSMTKHKAAWVFALYPKTISDVKTKNVCTLSICALSADKILTELTDAEDIDIEEYADCAEALRLFVYKNGLAEAVSKYNPEPVHINEGFLNRLRIRFIIVQGLLLFSNRKQKQAGEVSSEELHSIAETIKAIHIYQRLTRLSSLESLTEFQKLSGMCLRRALLRYLNEHCNQQFSSIREIFIPVLEPIIERTENLFAGKNEKCLYCGELTDSETNMCPAQHRMQRCCISYVQVPLLSGHRYCKYCNELALEDETLLKEVLAPGEKVRCAIFNCPLIETSKFLEV